MPQVSRPWETVETHVDPLALDRLRSQVEQEVEIKAVVELQLDTGRAVVDIERLVDVALTVAADHLALDVVFRSLGPLHEAVELGLLGRAGSELEGLGRGEIVVGSRIGDRTKFFLHFGNGDPSKPHCGHIVGRIELLRSRSVEIVVAAHGTCGLILFSFLNLTLTGLYTAQGDSKTPFVANFIGLLINLLLDPLLILGVGPFPRIEVAGAAVATVSAQLVVMFVMMVGVFRSKKEENVLKGIRLFEPFSKEELGNICKIGGPTAIQGMVYCMISMVLTRMVAAFGAEAIATQRVGGQIESVSWNTADGFAAALNAFVGQNYGAKKMDRVQKGYRISFWTVAIWGALIMLAFIIFPGPIAGVFFHEEKAMEIAISYLIIIGFSEAFMCVELMTIGALSGLGKTKLCSVISITATSMRIPLAMLLSRTSLGLDGIWWALTLTSVAKGIIFYLTFRYQMREKC